MAAYNKFDSTVSAWLASSMNFASDTFKAFLSSTLPTSTQATYSSAREISGINGYTSGGATVTMNTSNTTGTVTVRATYASPTWTGTSATSSAGFGPFQYVVFYDSTTTNLLAWFDYGSPITVNSGDTFTLTPGSSNVLFTLA